jgi:DNA-binding CsgD family transcriptional regulator
VGTVRRLEQPRCRGGFTEEGLSYQETADALEVSRSTVEVHIRNLYKKLEAHSKTQALVSARRHGLL